MKGEQKKKSPTDIVVILVYVLYIIDTMKSHNDTFPTMCPHP
jgi:hypothetical protein